MLNRSLNSGAIDEPADASHCIGYAVRGRTAIITINRPAARNAINRAAREGLFDAFDRVEKDSSVLAAVLTGAGDRAFCAGVDLKELAETQVGAPPPGFLPILGDTIMSAKPFIAAVNGFAFAGGWLLAQMCDLCVASSSASFAITEAKVGRGMPWAAPLIHMLPQRIMMELLLLGEPITAQRAFDIGFINRVVPPALLLETAIDMAERIAGNAPLTVRAAKELVRISTQAGASAARRQANKLFEPVYRSHDAQEGPHAFREKRLPRWQGR